MPLWLSQFLWKQASLIFLWAILHYPHFLPLTLDAKSDPTVCSFGYSYGRSSLQGPSGGFLKLKRNQFYFGLHRSSKLLHESDEGRLMDTDI